ncbi:hypothetical protein POUND7_006816 [Theobroma cacao]
MAEQEAALLSNLTCLKLSSLPALESIWNEPTHHVSLQSLKEVTIHGCDKLKSIFSSWHAQSLMHLEQLEISQCNKLEQVFAFAQEMAEQEENQVALLSNITCLKLSSLLASESLLNEPTYHVSLQSLKEVIIHGCDKLRSIFTLGLAQSLMHLERLEISQCNKLEQVFAFAQEMAEQELSSLPALESIWKEPTHHVSLQSLKEVIIHSCDKLKSVFSPGLAQSLMHLEQLEISQCKKVEQVFAFAEEMAKQEENQAALLSNLTCLKLSSLPALESIWKEPTHHVSLQSLKKVIIHGCDKLKSILSPGLAQSLMHLEQLEISQCKKLEQVFAFAEKMAEQELSSLSALECIWRETTHHVSLQSLKEVIIHGCDKLKSIFSPGLAQSLMHLEQLEISQCNKLEQVFAFAQEMAKQEENQAALLSNLTCLKLSSLPALESIWKEPTHHVSLQSLKEVIIHGCDKLKSIFSPGLAQSLMHLEQLEISQCNKLEQVFACAKEMAEQEAALLSNLTCLKLSSLPALESIWKESTHHVSLQSLKEVIIHGCDQLKSIFSLWLAQSLMHLEQLEISQCKKLEQVFAFAEEMAKQEVTLLSNLTYLKLSSLPALESIWKELTHHAALHNLKYVKVHNCDKLKIIFSPFLFRSMLHLEQLEISQCNQLKQVFAVDKEMVNLEVPLLSPFFV